MNLLNQALGVHEQALQVKSRRLEVLAQNIANADTPHYKARDIDFKAVLGAACLLYTSPSPRDLSTSRMPSSA